MISQDAAENYRARFLKVLEYIETHLQDDLTVENLSSVAAYSKYHFHRQFSEFFEIGLYKYIQLCRMKRASFQLFFRPHTQIIDIALANGYEGPESFSRAFKKSFGQTPSDFRKQPQWINWHKTYEKVKKMRKDHMKSANHTQQIRIVNFKETKVAAFEHLGDPRRIVDSIEKFIKWRRLNLLPPKVSATYNIIYNNPAEIKPEEFRIDLCAAIEEDVAENEFGVRSKTIPSGRCAVLRHIGSDDTLEKAVRYLYADWLPQSGEELRDFPLFFQRITFFPDVPENDSIVDIFLPLKKLRE